MADYPINELLTRTLALERLKYLADAYLAAKAEHDYPRVRMINEERHRLKMQYMKAVK